jgi:phage terminase large subunit
MTRRARRSRSRATSAFDYDEDSGLDAQEWIPRIEELCKDRGYKVGKVWLPHDAKAKTFQWRHSVHEQFSGHFSFERTGVVPQSAKHDRINAARTLMPLCYFHRTRCAEGLAALRSWSFAFDDERRVYSREPLHDWASNGADAFSYGAQVMRERKKPQEKPRGIPGPKPWTGDWLVEGKYDFVTPAQVSRYRVE